MEAKNEKQGLLEERSEPLSNDPFRSCYFRDQTKIIHSCAFRRLKDKTQVFGAPENDHICTRVEHVLHVAAVAKSICHGFNNSYHTLGEHFDEDLAFAIGLGHDLGHAPFGHTGEKVLNEKLSKSGKHFMHELNGYRMVEKIERLNLTFAVKDGIMCHNGEEFEQCLKPAETINDLESITSRKDLVPSTLEGCVVRFSDKIAYFGRDIEDALSAKLIEEKDIPGTIKKGIGYSNKMIINYLIGDLVKNSSKKYGICLSDNAYELMGELKRFNYEHIYHHKKLKNIQKTCEIIVHYLYDYVYDLQRENDWEIDRYSQEGAHHIDMVFGDYLRNQKQFYMEEKKQKCWTEGQLAEQITVDFISGMTDVFAIRAYKDLVIPSVFNSI